MSLAGGGVDVLGCQRRESPRPSLRESPGAAGVPIDEQGNLVFTSDRAAAPAFEEHV